MTPEPTAARTHALWNSIRDRLDRSLPSWTERIESLGQVAALERRQNNNRWSDDEVFKALLLAVLSNNTDWSKVERIIPELRNQFSDYSLKKYAETTEHDVAERYLPWFQVRRAGSMTLRRALTDLAKTARLLRDWSLAHGSAEHYFLNLVNSLDGDPKRTALELGRTGSRKKLPGLGVPLAAESLRNMGFDLGKPDRHLCRAVGSFGFVQFRKWPQRSGTKPPQSSPTEMLTVMVTIEFLADAIGVKTTFLDNAIWLLCSQSGLHMSNATLESLGHP